MQHTGELYLSKAKPELKVLADGRYQLTMLTVDRLGAHQVEPWRLVWTGDEAKAFFDRAQAYLTPGQPVAVTLTHARCHRISGLYAEIHAQVNTMSLAMRKISESA